MIPTLTDVRNWDVKHLTEAANHWTSTATVWEDRFTDYAQQVQAPGGVPWEGKAAEAAQQLAHSDRITVIGLADQLHEAAKIARWGALELAEAQRIVMRTVEAAQAEGFTVGEDFSVTDDRVYNRAAAALRQAQAEGFAADLRAHVGALVATDARLASEITAAAGGLGSDVFAEPGSDPGAQGVSESEASATSGPKNEPLFTPSDWAWGAAGAAVSAKTDIPGYFVEKAMVDVPKGAPGSWVKTALTDIKGVPFLKGVKPAGGVLGAIFMVPAVMSDMKEDHNVLAEAITRETGGFFAGAATGAMVGTAIGGPVGTVVGIAVGGVVSMGASKFIDKAWEPVGQFVQGLFG